MSSGTPLFPVSASTIASRVDALYFFLLGITLFFSLLIAGLIVYYAVRMNAIDRKYGVQEDLA